MTLFRSWNFGKIEKFLPVIVCWLTHFHASAIQPDQLAAMEFHAFEVVLLFIECRQIPVGIDHIRPELQNRFKGEDRSVDMSASGHGHAKVKMSQRQSMQKTYRAQGGIG